MKRLIAAAALAGFFLWPGTEISIAGSRTTGRARPQNVIRPSLGVVPAPVLHPNGGHQFHRSLGHPHYRYDYYYYPPHRYYHAPVIIVAPSYHYPYYHSYYSPASVFLSAPFYCFTHYEGFVSRIGFIDHVSGTHKIPINTVAAICPDGHESCVIE